MTPEELAQLFEAASGRWAMMSAIADPAKIDQYASAMRLCELLARSIRMAMVDENEFAVEIVKLSAEMDQAKFCIHCGQKLTYGLNRCPRCGNRVLV